MRIFLLAAVSAVAISGAALAADKPMYGAWGVDLTARDTAVKPGDDFNKFANGSWEKRTTIPADQPSAGVGYDVFNRSQDQLRTLIETAPANTQIGGLYKSFTDEAKVEQVDDAPLKADLARIAAIATKADMAKALGAAHGGFGSDLFSLDIYPDAKTPELNVLYIGQSGLGLPDRDYYLTDGFKPQLEAYRAFAERALKMAGAPDPAKSAADVIAFETAIAKVSWPVAERRDVEKTYNPMTIAELQASAPEIPWSDYLAAAGAPSLKSVVLGEKTAVRDIAKLFAATPLETLKAWQTVQGVQEMSPYLSKRFVDSRFEFVKVLSGQTQLRPRWKRGVTLVDGSLGELVGQAYVAKYFPPSSKAQMVELIGNLKVAVDGPGHQAGGADQAVEDAGHGRLSRLVARLFGPQDRRRRPLWQRPPQRRFRMGLSAVRPGQAGRPRQVGHDPADGERL